MSKIPHVVDGEASESDSEVEIAKFPEVDLSARTNTFVISGEGPESDDETKLRSPITEADLDAPLHLAMSASQSIPSRIIYNSLLHQKLWECNVSLRATVEGLAKHTTDISVEKLTRADKTLLNVQECMRTTNANLTLARARLKQLHAELEKANCSSAFPTVKIRSLGFTALESSTFGP